MKEIIDWIKNVEDRASVCYEKAAALFSEEKHITEILAQLASDERYHRNIMARAAECVEDKKDLPSFITLDDETKQKIERPFVEFEKFIDEGKITKQALFDYIISSEYSEWNELYLYVVETLKECSPDFATVAPKMHQHKRRIERFLKTDAELTHLIERVKVLPSVWQEKILVVDDSEMLVELFSTILREEGLVEKARNGEEALKKLGRKYFAAIVTNVEMPVMDGIEFYEKAVELYPHMNERILFCTGNDNYIPFFRDKKVNYRIKPVPLNELRRAVVDILNRPAE